MVNTVVTVLQDLMTGRGGDSELSISYSQFPLITITADSYSVHKFDDIHLQMFQIPCNVSAALQPSLGKELTTKIQKLIEKKLLLFFKFRTSPSKLDAGIPAGV